MKMPKMHTPKFYPGTQVFILREDGNTPLTLSVKAVHIEGYCPVDDTYSVRGWTGYKWKEDRFYRRYTDAATAVEAKIRTFVDARKPL